MFVKEGIYFPLFSDDNFCPHTSLIAATNPFPSSSFFCQLFSQGHPGGRGSSFRRAVDNVGLVRSLLPGVPLIVVIVMAATASPTTQTRAEDQLK